MTCDARRHGITHSLHQTRPRPLKFAMGGVWTERPVTERQRCPFFFLLTMPFRPCLTMCVRR